MTHPPSFAEAPYPWAVVHQDADWLQLPNEERAAWQRLADTAAAQHAAMEADNACEGGTHGPHA